VIIFYVFEVSLCCVLLVGIDVMDSFCYCHRCCFTMTGSNINIVDNNDRCPK